MNCKYFLISGRPGAARGFSLLELLMALSTILIAMAVSIPSYQVWVDNARLSSAAYSVLDGLQRAKSEAVRRNRNVVLRFTSTSWQLFVDADGTVAGTAGNFIRDDGELILRTTIAPAGTSFHEVKFGGSNPYTGFNSRGMPINSNCVGTVKGKNQGGKTFTVALTLGGSVEKR